MGGMEKEAKSDPTVGTEMVAGRGEKGREVGTEGRDQEAEIEGVIEMVKGRRIREESAAVREMLIKKEVEEKEVMKRKKAEEIAVLTERKAEGIDQRVRREIGRIGPEAETHVDPGRKKAIATRGFKQIDITKSSD